MRRTGWVLGCAAAILLAAPATAGDTFGDYDGRMDLGLRYTGAGVAMEDEAGFDGFRVEVRETEAAVFVPGRVYTFSLAVQRQKKGKIARFVSDAQDLTTAQTAHDDLLGLIDAARKKSRRESIQGGPVTFTSARVGGKAKSLQNGDRLKMTLKFKVEGTIDKGPHAGATVRGKLKLRFDGGRDFGF